MRVSESVRSRIHDRLARLYPKNSDAAMATLLPVLEERSAPTPPEWARQPSWSQQDAVLITYGDQVRCADGWPLACLAQFLRDYQLDRAINTTHLLPFFPYSSDDGFSVIDYRRVDPALGTWEDVHQLGQRTALAFDVVLNHVSSQSPWFQAYLRGEEPYVNYFIEVDPATDLSSVVRPRSAPLLTPFETSRGRRWLWTTFSDDQIDLNYANPAVLAEMIGIMLDYVDHGASILRLDAIAYLWKEIGTACIHLQQTHEVVKLLRDIVDWFAPGTLLLTETNVPHRENVSYFGQGDEAHLVYQFSLPPLLLDALIHDDARWLAAWLAGLEPTPERTSFFNFTASHDGIGVRPLEGLVPDGRAEQLAEHVRRQGGLISTRRTGDGRDVPYELNCTYFDALGGPGVERSLQVERFLASQAVMLSLRGIPGIYFQSILAGQNDIAGVRQTGRARSINRRKYQRREIDALLAESDGPSTLVFRQYLRLLAMRRQQPAFHPEAAQQHLAIGHAKLLAFRRVAETDRQSVTVVANLSKEEQSIELAILALNGRTRDLLAAARIEGQSLRIRPLGVAWLVEA